jgi:phenylpropionate dioxygenase-like ring-hydroxylating dioxygenase large terminal subunit
MFLGLVQDIPNGQINPLIQFNNRWSLTKNSNVLQLISNVCPHQNSLLTTKVCNDTVICPYHGLKFNSQGSCNTHEYKLDTLPVSIVSNMVFSMLLDFEYPIDLSHMKLVEQRVDAVKCTPEIIMDVFLDIDHIPVAHPGVYDKIDITDISQIKYDFFTYGSHQYVIADDDSHIVDADKKYKLGALWTAVYPNITIEWQPGALFVNVAVANGNDTNVVVYKYRDSRYNEHSWVVNSNIWEEAWQQDRDLCERIVEHPTRNLPPLKMHYLNAIKK